MKKTSQLLLSLLMLTITVGHSSCKKDTTTKTSYHCNSCATAPEALAANDASSKGIYKGVVIGSTGTIKFDVLNNGSAITALMVIDGDSVTLVSNVTWTAGTSYVAPFAGTFNGQTASITFSVDLSGSNPTISSVNIPGHPNATLMVAKETSNSQVVCFEGTYSGTESGTLNLLLSTTLGQWGGVARKNGSSTISQFNGTVVNNSLTCTGCGSGSIVNATLSGDQIINGSWNDGQGGSGSWSANKTM